MMRQLKFFGGLIMVALLCGAPAWAQETVCLQCHGGMDGRLGEPVSQWQGSIHEQNGNSCHGCHGGDPTDFDMAMSPERGFVGVPSDEEIPAFCGRCHVGVKEDYLASAHGRALGEGGPQCVTCHGNHAVRKASLDLINPEDCTRCHEYGRAEEIRGAMLSTEGMIVALEDRLLPLQRQGIDTTVTKGQVFALRNAFHRLFHSVEVERVTGETAGFQKDLEKIGEEVAAVEGQLASRRWWGGLVVAGLILTGFLLLLIRRTYEADE